MIDRHDRRGKITLAVGVTLALLALCACASDESDDEELGVAEPPFIETGDLDQILERGKLRVLIPRRGQVIHLPRGRHAVGFERELAESYARNLGLEIVWVLVDSREELITSLLSGRGDFVLGNLTATDERRTVAAFTVPIAVVREQVVSRASEAAIEGATDLDGRRIALRRSSSFRATVETLQEEHPGIEIEEVPETVDTEEIIHRVAIGRYDLTVADSNLVRVCLEYRDDIRPALDLTGDRTIAWAVRPHSEQLLESLNRHLNEAQLADRGEMVYRDDLPGIAERKVLRILTWNTAATYFLYRGELKGFEYELAKHFAREQRLRLEVIVPPDGEDLLRWLREGRGDIVAAALTPSDERRAQGVEFTQPYNFVSQMVVTRADDPIEIASAEDLAGRRFFVRRGSSYWPTLQALRESGVEIEIETVPEQIQTEQIIARVATGEYDLTLADSHILGIELHWRDDVRAAFELSTDIPLAWAVRDDNPELLAAASTFFKKEYRGLEYNILYRRYFLDEKRVRRHVEQRNDGESGISPYDEMVQHYSALYGFDWRLIAAQMYQESRFRPDARSFAGAQGLMQVLPTTASELGFTDLDDPEESIHAGVKYMDWVRDRFEPELHVQDRMWFTLASYNAGTGHVRDARRLARRMGLNPNRWFGEVEQAMLLLSRPKYASAMPHGYCRCIEPVNYVREIRARYNAYVDALGQPVEERSRAALEPSPADPVDAGAS